VRCNVNCLSAVLLFITVFVRCNVNCLSAVLLFITVFVRCNVNCLSAVLLFITVFVRCNVNCLSAVLLFIFSSFFLLISCSAFLCRINYIHCVSEKTCNILKLLSFIG